MSLNARGRVRLDHARRVSRYFRGTLGVLAGIERRSRRRPSEDVNGTRTHHTDSYSGRLETFSLRHRTRFTQDRGERVRVELDTTSRRGPDGLS